MPVGSYVKIDTQDKVGTNRLEPYELCESPINSSERASKGTYLNRITGCRTDLFMVRDAPKYHVRLSQELMWRLARLTCTAGQSHPQL